MEYVYDVTVLVATYNSEFEKIKKTLESIIRQKGILLQIVVVDDGSVNNHFDAIEEYLSNKDFYSYKLLANKDNRGTVKNYLSGLEFCEGKWIKPFSPGDYFHNDSVLRNWIKNVEEHDTVWSFGDLVYRTEINLAPSKMRRHPFILNPYRKGLSDKCRINYVLYGDSVNGASVLCSKEYLLKYLPMIARLNKYAEDYMYILMMWDGFLPYYYDDFVVVYEFGSGISTAKNRKWTQILIDERNRVNNYIINDLEPRDRCQRKIRRGLKVLGINKYLQMIICFFRGELMIRFEPKKCVDIMQL